MSLFQFGIRRLSSGQRRPVGENESALPSHMPSLPESGLGQVEFDAMASSEVGHLADPAPSAAKKRKKRGKYVQYTPEERARIGRYAVENGNEKARLKFQSNFSNLSESTIRNFKKAYLEKLNHERKQARPKQVTAITAQPRGRPPILLELDGKILQYLKALRSRGGVVNIDVVRASTLALIESNPSTSQQLVKFNMPRSWVQSIYRRLGFSKRMGTTGRPPVPQGLFNECRREYLRDIYDKVQKYGIPPDLVLNADQTPSSYISVGKSTMTKRGEKSVPIKGITDKRNITLTFVVSLSGEFLPIQIIYAGKTTASQPRGFKFPKGFCISQNPKHWSNEQETLKLIDEVVNPYVVKKRSDLKLAETQKALMVWDAFKGQKTEAVEQKLTSCNIELVTVPPNMTLFFQPLDLTVNGVAKKYMKKEFFVYYSSSVKQQLDSGKRLEDIDVDFRLTVIKPLHAQWLVNMFNFFTSQKGADVIVKGWKKAGIVGVLDGTIVLPSEDPFSELI